MWRLREATQRKSKPVLCQQSLVTLRAKRLYSTACQERLNRSALFNATEPPSADTDAACIPRA